MTHEDAISFLREHQPLPDDKDMDKETIETYDEVRKWFLKHPDPACVPLFLNSFGDGSGFGVYQLVEDVMARHQPSDVISHLRKALTSPQSSIRYWVAQIATRFPHQSLVQPLCGLLDDQDSDVRCAAITALEVIGGEAVRKKLQEALGKETDEDARILLQEILDSDATS